MNFSQAIELIKRAQVLIKRMPFSLDPSVSFETAHKLVAEAHIQLMGVRGVAPIFKKLTNEFLSASDAIAAGRSYSMLKFNELENIIPAIEHIAVNYGDAHAVSEEAEDEAKEQTGIDDAVFKKYATESKRVDIGNKPFGIFRAPIVVIGQIKPQAMARTGIKVDVVSDYVILHNQVVVGINMSEHKDRLAEANRVIAITNRQNRRDLQIVTEKGFKYKNAVWYWYVEQHNLAAMQRAGLGRVTNWGFAFN